jgi:hypothetical protein
MLGLLLTIVLITVFFGLVETRKYSAYGACREIALQIKGYGTWQHTRTVSMVFLSTVYFYDGVNWMNCDAIGIGPFWMATSGWQTIRSYAKCLPPKQNCEYPQEYFGVSP